LFVVGTGTAVAWAGGYGDARIVRNDQLTRPVTHRFNENSVLHLGVVQRPVTQSAALVSRALSDQPVHEYLVEVNVVNTTIYLDPQKDYYRQGQYRIGEDHHILRALRLHAALTARPARVIRHTPSGQSARETDGIEPVMIINKGELFQRKDRPTPTTPKQDKLFDRVVQLD